MSLGFKRLSNFGLRDRQHV